MLPNTNQYNHWFSILFFGAFLGRIPFSVRVQFSGDAVVCFDMDCNDDTRPEKY
jgi:hypothetical protein